MTDPKEPKHPHSPTPVRTQDEHSPTPRYTIALLGLDDTWSVRDEAPNDIGLPMRLCKCASREGAEFIAGRLEAHDALVEALAGLLRDIDDGYLIGEPASTTDLASVVDARAALAAAKKGGGA